MRLIDADNLIELCHIMADKCYEYEEAIVMYSQFETMIESVPTAQQWIPVSERLPEEYGNYQVSTSMGLVVTDYYASYGWDDDCDDNYVVAWRPLPEPYREVEK